MDRLLSGDVGFGKLKLLWMLLLAVIIDGYQAILYVQQHFLQLNTIKGIQRDLKFWNKVAKLWWKNNSKRKTVIKRF